jgi:uncharacterized protein YceH (UPF0502 family)
MSDATPTSPASPSWVPLTPRERRVLGVLVEKAKTTPEYYPLTVAALVAGCNQKSNRDPVTNYDADDVEATLQGLRQKGAAILVEAGGRVPRWKHTLYDWLKVGKVELAIVAELLLRGPQTEGELRTRASRMEPIADLPTLQGLLENLAARNLALVLSPPGQKRGVIVSHGLYPPEELERVRRTFASQAIDSSASGDAPPARPSSTVQDTAPAWVEEIAALRDEVETLRGTLQALAEDVRALKAALGA